MAETAHAQLRQRSPCREAAGHVDPGVNHPGPVTQCVDGDSQLVRPLQTVVRECPRTLVHPKVGHRGYTRTRASTADCDARVYDVLVMTMRAKITHPRP